MFNLMFYYIYLFNCKYVCIYYNNSVVIIVINHYLYYNHGKFIIIKCDICITLFLSVH